MSLVVVVTMSSSGSGVSSNNDKDMNNEHEVVNEEGEVSLLPISPHDMPSSSVLECTTNDDCSNGLTCHLPSGTCACARSTCTNNWAKAGFAACSGRLGTGSTAQRSYR